MFASVDSVGIIRKANGGQAKGLEMPTREAEYMIAERKYQLAKNCHESLERSMDLGQDVLNGLMLILRDAWSAKVAAKKAWDEEIAEVSA